MDIKLSNLNKTIINCKKCPRLVKFVNKVSNDKRKQNRDDIYWGKPVPGLGNINSNQQLMAEQELVELLQGINLVIFYLNVYFKQEFLIYHSQNI